MGRNGSRYAKLVVSDKKVNELLFYKSLQVIDSSLFLLRHETAPLERIKWTMFIRHKDQLTEKVTIYFPIFYLVKTSANVLFFYSWDIVGICANAIGNT